MRLNKQPHAGLTLGWGETKPRILTAGACLLDALDCHSSSLPERGAQGWVGGPAPSPAAIQGASWSRAEPQFSPPQNGNKSAVPNLSSPPQSKQSSLEFIVERIKGKLYTWGIERSWQHGHRWLLKTEAGRDPGEKMA